MKPAIPWAVACFACGLLVAGAGCGETAQSDEDAQVPQKVPQAVVAMHVMTSFLDTGIKGVIFPDGTTFAWRGSFGQQAEQAVAHRFQLSAAERAKMFRAFQQHRFFKLPAQMRTNVTDGADRIVSYGDAQQEHVVLNYMTKNAEFDEVQQQLEKLLEQKLKAAKSKLLTAEETVKAVAQQIDKLSKDAPSRTTATQWLDLTVRRLSGTLDAELIEKHQIPGDGAAVYRRVRSQ